MKKTVVKGLIPLMAGAAVIGSGFSIWFFQETKVEKSQELSKEITQVANVGTLAVADNIKVTFDQSKAGRTALSISSSSEAKGIYTTLGTVKKAIYTPVDSSTGEVDELDGEVYHKFTTTISVNGALGDYFDIAYNDTTATLDKTVARTWKITLANNVNEFDWEKVSFSYKENMEPKNIEQYNELKTLVNDDSTKITANYLVEVLPL